MSKRVVVGMSGGVDSSVAAYLLNQAGYDVIGLFMRNWDSTTNKDVLGNPTLEDDLCPQEVDYQDAKRVCDFIGIPLHRVDFIEEYWQNVFMYFIDEYEKGRTPNPDIMCNKFIKFDAFKKYAEKFNPDFIAMGHYAQIRIGSSGNVQLLRGADANKDQTYFLSQLTQEQLKETLFPIGHYQKSEIRQIAKEINLPTAMKKDSTGICFIGERAFNQFLRNYIPAQPGRILTQDGDDLGEHQGLMHYTIGQRKGLGIGGSSAYGNEPWFVIGKSLTRNTLTVGQGFHHPELYSTSCTLESVNMINPQINLQGLALTAKFRYRQADVPISIESSETEFKVIFKTPVRAVTPGQSAVFYHGDVCLGGGIIQHVYQNHRQLPY